MTISNEAATALYETTDYYYTSNASDLFNVSKKTPAISVVAATVTYPNTVTVTLTSNVTGNYKVKVDGQEKEISLITDKAQVFVYIRGEFLQSEIKALYK